MGHTLQRLATVAHDGKLWAFPDSLVGTDSHTPVVNGLAVFGWGVGGIEATTALLGRPIGLLPPRVVGCRLTSAPPPGVLAADIALSLTERLRPADDLRPQSGEAGHSVTIHCRFGRSKPKRRIPQQRHARPSSAIRACRRTGALARALEPATSDGVARRVKAQNRATEAYGVAP